MPALTKEQVNNLRKARTDRHDKYKSNLGTIASNKAKGPANRRLPSRRVKNTVETPLEVSTSTSMQIEEAVTQTTQSENTLPQQESLAATPTPVQNTQPTPMQNKQPQPITPMLAAQAMEAFRQRKLQQKEKDNISKKRASLN